MGKKGGNHLPTVAVRWHHMFSVVSPQSTIIYIEEQESLVHVDFLLHKKNHWTQNPCCTFSPF